MNVVVKEKVIKVVQCQIFFDGFDCLFNFNLTGSQFHSRISKQQIGV